MDYSHCRKVSLLEGEEVFFNKVLSRDSSVGYSSRILYYRSAEGVPFKWEMQPGTPKDPPKEDIIPPLSPPPAVLSLGLPKPCINIGEPKTSMGSKFMFWKQNKKNQDIIRVSKENDVNEFNSENFVGFEFYSSDGEEFTASPRNSSSSSSSSSFSNAHSVQSSRMQSSTREKIEGIYGCNPWYITSILVCVGRRS